MRNSTTAQTYRIPAILTLIAIAAILAFSAVITVSAQSDDPDWKQAVTGLSVAAGDQAGELDLAWNAHPQTTKTLQDYRVTWTPDGEAFRPNSESDWYAYPTTNEVTVTGLEAGASYKVRVRARYDDNKKSRWSDVVTGQSGAPTDTTPVNTPASGQPTITGTAEVGETLTAGISAISDDNGLTNATFNYQWIRSSGGTDTEISGATDSSYLLSANDLDKTIKVQVSFTDDDGYSETLTSQATDAVVTPPNTAATGQPTISGTAEVGETLSAGTSGISDDNGLTNASFAYQWIRNTAGGHNDISGAANASYVITSDDTESKIQVRVSFNDDDGYSESVTSNATPSVQVPAIVPPEEPQIARAAGDTEVPDDWNLLPTGIGLGDRFRLIFLSSTKRNATSSSISAYNTFIQDRAAAGRSALDNYSSLFKVVGCTDSTSARNNTSTTFTNSNKGVPIYWLNGNKVADDYEDFYDETWDDEANDKNESGNNGPNTSNSDNYPATGCDHDGTKASGSGGASRALGSSAGLVRLGRPNSTDSGTGPLSSFSNANTSNSPTRFMYGLSPVFIVVEFSDDAKLSALTIEGATNGETIDLSPAFTANRGNYTADVPHSIDAVTLTATKNESNARVAITDDDDTSSENEADLDLAVGDTTLTVTVTAQDGSTKTYTIIVTRSESIVLVSNTGQTRANESSSIQSQPFTTGSNLGGYTLTSVDVGIHGDNLRTRLFHIVPNKGNGEPDLSDPTKFITLTTPGSTSADKIHTFTAPADAKLAANTTYHLHLANSDGGAPGNIHRVSSQDEDDGGAAGWSIGNKRYWRNSNTDDWNDDTTNIVRMQINGLNAPPSTNATLSSLDLVRTSDSQTVTLSPVFDDETFTYTGGVPNAIDAIALTAATTDSNATVVITSDDDTSTPNTADFDLDVGQNTFTVTVTAEDTTSTETYTVTVTRGQEATGTIAVPLGWSLIPSGVAEGGQFRLLFLSGVRRAGSSSAIADYNTFAQERAAAGHAHIQVYSDHFTAVACTENDDARDNTSTTYTSSEKGVPIYWLNGTKVADDYEDFYDGDWDDEANGKNESGNNAHSQSQSANYPLTGCDHDGTEKASAGVSSALGNGGDVTIARLNSSGTNHGPISSNGKITETFTRPMYGISPVFTVAADAVTQVPDDWSLTPSELGGLDQFRLLFLSSTKRNATSSDITDYNTFVQTRAAAGHTDIQAYSDTFTVVACTEDVDARDNTATTYTSSDRGVPIYWLDGDKAADNYADFYDGRWDNATNSDDRNELGINGTNTANTANRPWTGCEDNGTEAIFSGTSFALGKTSANTGDPVTNNPINSAIISSNSDQRPMYGLSQVFQSPPDANLDDLVIEGATNGESISLSPAFDEETFTYTAGVPNEIDDVTLTATKNDSNATVAITDDDDATTPNTADFDLDVGANTFTVTVTAEDGTTQTYTITVTRAIFRAEPTQVPESWSLKPSRLVVGDEFRLIFLSSTKRNASSSSIGAYNTFVQNLAAAGHDKIQPHSDAFTVVGCTANADARDNTSTRHNSADRGVPIYWLGGSKVADDYQDFYDGSWNDEANDKNENGNNGPDTSQPANQPWTGCEHNGTESLRGSGLVSAALGQGFITPGTPNSGFTGDGPISSNTTADGNNNRPMYGLSAVFQVVANEDATLRTLNVEGATNGESIPLSPAFDEETFTYTAAVPIEIEDVTLTVTNNNSNAIVVITDDDDTSTTHTADFDLDLGANTFAITVTAEDDTTYTYTVTITRIDIPPSPATVTANWGLTPDGLFGGDQFRLLFYSSTKRDAESANIADYNSFIQARAAAGHADIQSYSDGFNAVGCTENVDARDNTRTRYTDSDTGVPIYWMNGNKVADNYRDFYDGSWDNEANDQDRNERGDTGPNSDLNENLPWTGCEHDGTEAIINSTSEALGNADDSVRIGTPGSDNAGEGPINSNSTEDSDDERPLYGLSQVFTILPGNTGTLTTGGTPRSETLGGSDSGNYWQVKLHKNVRYRIDVKGSEPSQQGGTLTNPWLQLIAGSDRIQLLNGSAAGVSQSETQTEATAGGAGQNSRLDVKVLEAADGGTYYHLLVHRAEGDNGSYTITVNRLDWPQGRLAPDITVTREDQTSIRFEWEEPAKTQDTLVAPLTGYKVQYRARPGGSWSAETTKNANQRSHEFTGLTAGQKYQVRVRAYHNNQASNNTYQWGYATVYTDDCAINGNAACSINVNQTEAGRVNYTTGVDQDSYRVRLFGGTTYVIEAKGKSSGSGTLVDPQLYLRLASNDSQAAYNDDGGNGRDSKLTYTPSTTQDYFIRVSPWAGNDRGTYKVKVREQ